VNAANSQGFAPLARLALYASLTRLDKPIGISLLLWPTLDALWIAAGGTPGVELVAIFVVGTVLMRSAGCAINDVADRKLDRHVERTANRVLTRGAISTREALAVALVLALCAALTLPLMRPEVTPLAFVAVAVSASYPYVKRFFPMPQAYLGIAFSFGIPMAYAAILGHVPREGWLLFAINLFWVIAYDTEYAMTDRRDDLIVGIKSSAILFGRWDVRAVGLCYAAYLACMAYWAVSAGWTWRFALGWTGALACALVHLVWIRGRDPAQCLRAFRHNHWFGLSIFAGIVFEFAAR
jgi:4-hydroxybenzoate polyprenyltransferase